MLLPFLHEFLVGFPLDSVLMHSTWLSCLIMSAGSIVQSYVTSVWWSKDIAAKDKLLPHAESTNKFSAMRVQEQPEAEYINCILTNSNIQLGIQICKNLDTANTSVMLYSLLQFLLVCCSFFGCSLRLSTWIFDDMPLPCINQPRSLWDAIRIIPEQGFFKAGLQQLRNHLYLWSIARTAKPQA